MMIAITANFARPPGPSITPCSPTLSAVPPRLGLRAARAGLVGLLALGCDRPPPPSTSPRGSAPPEAVAVPDVEHVKVEVRAEAMGGPLLITVRCPPDQEADCRSSAQAALAEVSRIEDLATDWTPTGEIAQLNAAAGRGPVPISPEVLTLLTEAQRIARVTDGAFDVTINALWGLWDFKQGRIADPGALARRLSLVNWRRLKVSPQDGTAELLDPGMSVTLGGLAQGYAADRALALIPAEYEAMVDVSGDIGVRGSWRVGVQHPRAERNQIIAALTVTDAFVITSGDYERTFIHEGVRYHHILDPHTGQPSKGAMSATVVASSGTVADGLATALMVSGAHEAPMRDLDAWALVIQYDGGVRELNGPDPRVSALEVSARP